MSKIILIDCEVLPKIRTDHYKYPLTGRTEPLGLQYLAAHLIEHNHEARIMQLPLTENDKQVIRSADVVGFSVLTYQWNEFRKTAALVRKLNQKAILVAGREHPTALPEMCLNKIPELDYVVCGEGEVPLLQIANNDPPEDIKGIVYRATNQSIIINPRPARLISWPNQIREKNRMTVPLMEWLPIAKKSAGIMISRGCPFNCDFCTKQQMWGKKYFCQQIESVVDEIVDIQQRYNVDFFAFHDLMFPLNLLRPFCESVIRKKISARFFTMMSAMPNQIDWQLVRKAGFVEVAVGVEIPTNQRKEIGKGHSFNLAKRFISNISSAGIAVRVYLIIGWPHEKDVNDIVNLYLSALKEMAPHFIRVHFLTPFPGTKIWKRYKQNIIFQLPDGFERFTTMEPVLEFNIPPEQLREARKAIMGGYYGSSNFIRSYGKLDDAGKRMVDAFLENK